MGNSILTDPPYCADGIPLWDDLAVFAERVLVNGGVLLSLAGQYHLPAEMNALCKTLAYVWTFSLVHGSNESTLVYNHKLRAGWKPVLMFCKGKYEPTGYFNDVLFGGSREKDFHPWQQGITEMLQFVRMFSEPGDLVVDPFGGSFTTALACEQTGRRCISTEIDAEHFRKGFQRVMGQAA